MLRKPYREKLGLHIYSYGQEVRQLLWCGRVYPEDLITQIKLKSVNLYMEGRGELFRTIGPIGKSNKT